MWTSLFPCMSISYPDWYYKFFLWTDHMNYYLQWHHNGRNGVSNHQPHHCLLNCLFRRRSKKTSKLRITGLCAGNSPVTGEFAAHRASNVKNVSIWWCHHILNAVRCTASLCFWFNSGFLDGKQNLALHYGDVIMSTMASQITSLTIVYSTVYSGADQRKYQSSMSLTFVRGIHLSPVNSPHTGPAMRKMFPFDDITMYLMLSVAQHHYVFGSTQAFWMGKKMLLFQVVSLHSFLLLSFLLTFFWLVYYYSMWLYFCPRS